MTTPKQRILKERGLLEHQELPHARKHLKHRPQVPTQPHTPLMRYIALTYCGKETLEQVLLSGSLSMVAKRFDNEVDVSTISKWIKKLGLKYTVDNLPECNGCKKRVGLCDSGICMVLYQEQQWHLVPVKKQQVLESMT